MNDTDDSDLFKDRSFWGVVITQFLGAFNDNLYKQLMLLMAIPGVGALIQGDRQGWATTVFSLPFVLLSSTAGYLADRYSKSQIITICKIAEIAITLLAVTAFWFYGNIGDYGTWTVLVLMGTHSAFFGPSKYGILPELFRDKYLPRANGLILMTTFLAIIFGSRLCRDHQRLVGEDQRRWLARFQQPLDRLSRLHNYRGSWDCNLYLHPKNVYSTAASRFPKQRPVRL